jgi:hypothetical protein
MNKFVIFAIVLLCSCTTQRISQFTTFAEAGSSYSEAMVKLTSEAGQIAIDADSELLLKDRDLFSQEERGNMYLERIKALESLFEITTAGRL